jgi:hypothetical protein
MDNMRGIIRNNLTSAPEMFDHPRSGIKAHGRRFDMTSITEKQCEQCGETFTPQRRTKRFCSSLCSHNSWISRHEKQWREYNEQWRQSNPDYWKEYYQDGRGIEVQKRRHEKHPLQRMARTAVSNALKLGKITRLDHCQAHGCNNTRLEAHHWKGYRKQNWLDVQWLCHKHHLEAERGNV